jgi:hypothetical protein
MHSVDRQTTKSNRPRGQNEVGLYGSVELSVTNLSFVLIENVGLSVVKSGSEVWVGLFPRKVLAYLQ